MIEYIRSGRVLVAAIGAAVEQLPHRGAVLDLFSGTSRVGHALKQVGFLVHADDCTRSSQVPAGCQVASSSRTCCPPRPRGGRRARRRPLRRRHDRHPRSASTITIHDRQRRKVGQVGHLENRALLYLVGPDLRVVQRMAAAASGARPTR